MSHQTTISQTFCSTSADPVRVADSLMKACAIDAKLCVSWTDIEAADLSLHVYYI